MRIFCGVGEFILKSAEFSVERLYLNKWNEILGPLYNFISKIDSIIKIYICSSALVPLLE